LKAVGLIANLSSRSGYEYTDKQVEAIRSALTAKIDAVMSNFNPKAAGDTTAEFTMD